MDSLNYKKLYALQDEVLDLVFATEKEFYLTGGTCLSRFYSEKRYSDDLDFFTNQSPRYSFALRNIKKVLMEHFSLSVEVEAKDFSRYKIDSLLQIDFVNDISFRYKEPIINEQNYLIDNLENILSNKISAIIGRDNPKDIFDLYLIWKISQVHWAHILEAAHNKTGFTNEELIIRLKTFPSQMLSSIKLTEPHFLDNFEKEFPLLISEIIEIDLRGY